MRKTHSVTPIDAKCSSLPGSGIVPNGTIRSVDGIAAGLFDDAAQLGERRRQAGATDRDPAVGVLGDVGEQLRPRGAADEHRRTGPLHRLRPRPARRDLHVARRRTPPTSSAQSDCIASMCSRATSRRSCHRDAVVLELVLVPAEADAEARTVRPTAGRASRRLGGHDRLALRGEAMPVPSRMRSVTVAAAASATNGSSVRLYSSGSSASPVGGGVRRSTGMCVCSGRYSESKPARLDLAGQLDDVHRSVGREHRDPEAHRQA